MRKKQPETSVSRRSMRPYNASIAETAVGMGAGFNIDDHGGYNGISFNGADVLNPDVVLPHGDPMTLIPFTFSESPQVISTQSMHQLSLEDDAFSSHPNLQPEPMGAIQNQPPSSPFFPYAKSTVPFKRPTQKPFDIREPVKRHKRAEGDSTLTKETVANDESGGNKLEQDPPTFACPFYRISPLQHRDCANRKLTRIRDVKQHLQRRHIQSSNYCPTCFETFSTTLLYHSHVRSRSCTTRRPTIMDKSKGLSSDALGRLKSRVKRAQTPTEQWNEVWDIVFDNTPRPKNPYLGSAVEEAMGMIRAYWQQESPQLMPRFLEKRGLSAASGDDLGALMTELLNEVHVRFDEKGSQELGLSEKLAYKPLNRRHSVSPFDHESDPRTNQSQVLESPNRFIWANSNPYVIKAETDVPVNFEMELLDTGNMQGPEDLVWNYTLRSTIDDGVPNIPSTSPLTDLQLFPEQTGIIWPFQYDEALTQEYSEQDIINQVEGC